MNRNTGILTLFPFLVTGSLSIAIMRELRRRGENVVIGRYLPTATGYTMDLMEDFSDAGCIVDMSDHLGTSGATVLEEVCRAHDIGLVIQAGSPWAYPHLSRLKERRPDLRMLDMLYNTGPHFHSFASYGSIFDAVLVESRMMVELLEDNSHGAEVHQIESGVDLSGFVPVDRLITSSPDSFVVGYFGRLSPEKNPIGFITLAEKLYADLPWVRFLICGQGPQEEEVRSRLSTSPAKEAIDFHGFVEHPSEAFQKMDVLVVPSILDGRPAAMMEAAACGVPVIGAPVGGISELIEEGRSGHLIKPQDHQAIAQILAEWRREPGIHARMRTEARLLAEARFDRNRMMDRYHSAVKAVLNGRGRQIGLCVQ